MYPLNESNVSDDPVDEDWAIRFFNICKIRGLVLNMHLLLRKTRSTLNIHYRG